MQRGSRIHILSKGVTGRVVECVLLPMTGAIARWKVVLQTSYDKQEYIVNDEDWIRAGNRKHSTI